MKVNLGTYLPSIPLISIQQEKSRKNCINDAKKLYYSFFTLANVQTLRIGELEPDLYYTDEKSKYIFLH